MASNSSEHPVDIYDDCPCSGTNLSRLLQPAIMTILAEKELHGYAIVDRLAETPMPAGELVRPQKTEAGTDWFARSGLRKNYLLLRITTRTSRLTRAA